MPQGNKQSRPKVKSGDGRIRLRTLKRIRESNPSEWEGVTTGGAGVWITYRLGWLRVRLGSVESDRLVWTPVLDTPYGGEYDGKMDLGTMKLLTNSVIEWGFGEEVEDQA